MCVGLGWRLFDWFDEGGGRIKKGRYAGGDVIETTYYVGKDFVRVVNSSGTFDVSYLRDSAGTLLASKSSTGETRYCVPCVFPPIPESAYIYSGM